MRTGSVAGKAASEVLPAPLNRIRLYVGGDAPLVDDSGEDDRGAMDWWGEASITVYTDEEDDEQDDAWWNYAGAALEKTVVDDGLKLTILRASGLVLDLPRVSNVYDALESG